MKTKKNIVILICLIIVCSNIWADDFFDVKYVVIQTIESIRDARLTEYLSYHSEDFVSISHNGKKSTYEDLVLCIKFMRDRDLYSFFQFLSKHTGIPATEKDKAKWAKLAKDPAVIDEYTSIINILQEFLESDAVLCLDTLKFIDVKIKGNQAVLIEEHLELENYKQSAKEYMKVRCTYTLNKKNGLWKISGITTVLKD